jgi:hypothetical protein
MHCAMLLDMLIRLAEGRIQKVGDSEKVLPRDLAEVAAEFTSLRIAKDDAHRQRYVEIIGQDWNDVEEGFFAYAVKDPIVTFRAYLTMMDAAERIMREHGYDPHLTLQDQHVIRPDAIQRFGLLSEAVQVKGAISLAEVGRTGMHLREADVAALHADYQCRLNDLIAVFLRDFPGLIKVDHKGNIQRNKKSGTPSVNETFLRRLLDQAADEVHQTTGVRIKVPRTPKGRVSTAAKEWVRHADRHPLFKLWVEREKVSKLCEFFGRLQGGKVHPRYNVLARTGRTTCENPNVQQTPREGGFRELYIPAPGYFLLAIDYSYIELRTLAAVCEAKFGNSKLGDTIRDGMDPHCYTAAMFLDMDFNEFLRLEKAEDIVEIDGVPQKKKGYWYKKHRQGAKPINFGVPGGLGPGSLVSYARSNYKVELTFDQARQLREKLITSIYAELNPSTGYLADEGMAALARNLKVPLAPNGLLGHDS